MPNAMSGVYLTGHGGPDKLEYRTDIPVPRPGPEEVVVRIAAAGVNNTDINTRLGWYSPTVTGATEDAAKQGSNVESGGWGGALQFPRIQGGDFCGTVAAVGEGVTSVRPGTRVTAALCIPRPTPENPKGLIVIGSEFDGAFAEYCLLDAADLHDVTASPLTDVEIAAIPCAYGTAEGLLTRAELAAGESVLITGASGGVGMAAVQLACLRDAEVTAVTSLSKAEAVRSAGARTILTRDGTPPEQAFDVVIDVVGGPGFPDLIRALKPGGRYAVSGAIAGPIVQTDLRDIYLKDLTVLGSTYQPPEVFARIVELMNSGQIRPLVSRTYPLSKIAEAQEDFQSKRFPGKLVLIPTEDET
ncbi:alcohol dehydrogenase family protein [Primorskyibacter sp. S87]|uniref:alcohol dehydrogenase family protein n=1 Tax=Primorskyibacter sp. S87 TaxID=3415126 RepID=UPI003C7E8985